MSGSGPQGRRGGEDQRDGAGPAGTGPGADDPDRVAAAVTELYGAPPEGFTERRGELATAARDAGDRAAAKAIGALRRPTRAAWVVNRLARADPNAPRKLAELAAALFAAQQAGHGPRLRELSSARGALVDALTDQALRAADVPIAPASLREEVSGTLTAAVADPQVAAEFAAGTLTRAAQWSGFGVLPAVEGQDSGQDADAAETSAASLAGTPEVAAPDQQSRDESRDGGTATDTPSRDVPGRAESSPAAEPELAVPGPRRAGSASVRGRARQGTAVEPAAGQATARAATERRQAEQAERAAAEAAERAARRRKQYEDAERFAASTASEAAEAVAAEDRLEAEVRDLEQRLTRARADLAAARMRARHAEAAQRRAQQALERLPRE